AVVAPAVTAAQPVRQPILDLYNQTVDCSQPVGQVQVVGAAGRGAVLPTDIALSALTGTGGFVVELGGGQVTTEGNTFTNPFDTADTPAPVEALPVPSDTSAPTGEVLGTSISGSVGGGAGTSPSPPELGPASAPAPAATDAPVPG